MLDDEIRRQHSLISELVFLVPVIFAIINDDQKDKDLIK